MYLRKEPIVQQRLIQWRPGFKDTFEVDWRLNPDLETYIIIHLSIPIVKCPRAWGPVLLSLYTTDLFENLLMRLGPLQALTTPRKEKCSKGFV